MMASLTAWLAESALMRSPVGHFITRVPRWVWIVLASALALGAVALWHGHKVRAFGAERYAAGYAAAQRDAAKATQRLDAKGVEVASDVRSKTDETNGRSHADASALRMRGPGRASATCVPAATGRHVEAGRSGDAAVARLPYPAVGELMDVPFDDLVDVAERCDLNRTEALAWREWYARISAEWANAKQGSK